VRLDGIGIVLRARAPWEAIDLGFAMLRRWWAPVYAGWAAAVVPMLALCLAVGWLTERPWLGLLLVWWLKPLYDRVVLHILSRAVFGELLTPLQVLKSAPQWLGTRLFSGLVLMRFDTVRSFILPVWQLEGLRGRAARQRVTLLSRRVRNYAVALTLACVHFEAVFLWSGGALLGLLRPAASQQGSSLWEAIGEGSGAEDVFTLLDVLAYAVAVSLVEPFYVAAGLALYLNRRSLLEGWDIEVALRRMAEVRAVASPTPSPLAGIVLAMALAATLAAAPGPAAAQGAGKDARREIAEVLKAPEFQTERDTLRWQRKAGARPAPADGDWRWLRAVGHAIARSAEVLFWIAVGALVVGALWWLHRALPRARPAARDKYRPPPVLFGLEVSPETLPDDVAGEAARLAQEGRLREALSLLYRGALSHLVLSRGVELHAGHTEEEVLRRARDRVSSEAGDYFASLVAAWQAAAYARRDPSRERVGQLVSRYATLAAADAPR